MRVGLGIGPNLGILAWQAGHCYYKIGHLFGTIALGFTQELVLVGVCVEKQGACYLDREPNLAIIIDKFSFSSPRAGRLWACTSGGVLIGAMCHPRIGWYVGTIWLVPSIGISWVLGVGSASMMAAATAPIM